MYRPMPTKPQRGQPWPDWGDATYDNLVQLIADVPALKTDVQATAAAADALAASKAPVNNPVFTGTVSGVTKAHVGLGSVDNVADIAKTFSATQVTSGTLPAARLPAGVAGVRRRLPADEQNPTANNWAARPSGFSLVLNVGAPPVPADADPTDILVPLAGVATTAGTTFTGIPDGSPWPAPWVVSKQPAGGGAAVSSGEGRVTTGSAVGAYSSTDATSVRHQNQATNGELLFTVRHVTSGVAPSLILRSSRTDLDIETGLSIPLLGTDLRVMQAIGWSYSVIGTPGPASWSSGVNYRVRVSLQGETVRVKQWPVTSTEPAAWGVTVTTTVLSAGSWGWIVKPGQNAGTYVAAFDDIVIS